VVTFDAALPGTTVERWADGGRLDALPPLALDGVDRVVVVAAHPDDETLGAGLLIAECGRRGIPLTVVVVTDGAASHPASPTTTPGELRGLRVAETTAAVHLLAPAARVRFLDFPDGGVREQRERITASLDTIVSAEPGRALVVAPWRGDGHRDHRVVGEVSAAVAAARRARLLEYPIWLWHWGTPESPDVPWGSLVALRTGSDAAARKREAIAAHASQTTALSDLDGDAPVLLPDFLRHFESDLEVYVDEVPAHDDPARRLPGEYFDELYARNDDPWRFQTRWYEQRKRAITVASLPDERYRSALEIGCSIGVLTEQLAARCERLLAVDVSSAAVEQARARTAHLPGVTVERRDVATEFPDGELDLVVISEVGYYFSRPALDAVLAATLAHLAEDATVIAVHWRHPVDDYLLTGDDVRAAIDEALTRDAALVGVVHHEEADFVLDVYRTDGRSVAERTGLA
jgi:LmbE family N-acetylglucosaminyl deacetylase/SAM-dependent methyltransferase